MEYGLICELTALRRKRSATSDQEVLAGAAQCRKEPESQGNSDTRNPRLAENEATNMRRWAKKRISPPREERGQGNRREPTR